MGRLAAAGYTDRFTAQVKNTCKLWTQTLFHVGTIISGVWSAYYALLTDAKWVDYFLPLGWYAVTSVYHYETYDENRSSNATINLVEACPETVYFWQNLFG